MCQRVSDMIPHLEGPVSALDSQLQGLRVRGPAGGRVALPGEAAETPQRLLRVPANLKLRVRVSMRDRVLDWVGET